MIKCLMDNLDGQSLLCISNNCWKKSSIVHDLYCPYLNSIDEDVIKKKKIYIKIDRSTIIRRITYESRKIKINRLYHYTYAMTYVYGTKMITERQWIPIHFCFFCSLFAYRDRDITRHACYVCSATLRGSRVKLKTGRDANWLIIVII